MNEFFKQIKIHKDKNLPFVMYSKPNSDFVFGLLQKNNLLFEVVDFTEKGFVFASFNKNKIVLVPEKESEIITAKFNNETVFNENNKFKTTDKKAKVEFQKVVKKAIEAIHDAVLKKVVISRKEEVKLNNFDFLKTFQNMMQLYPSTFRYCFFHPKVGFWMGATPEQLLKVTNNVFETTALAGTQKEIEPFTEIIWQQKEKEEQQYVTDFIVKKLKEVTSAVLVSKPYSLKAGPIWHIKTDISGVLNSTYNLKEVLFLLHPTPAICGLPKKKAMQFIVENENYNRTFYTGFLGELNFNDATDIKNSDLFVNLRCMQIDNKTAILYMGCGIVKESIAQKEWDESVNKSMTMKRVL